MPTIDMTKPYKTRDGRPVRLLCTDNTSLVYPVVGVVDDVPQMWTAGGRFFSERESEFDLVEVSPYADWPIDAPIWVRDYSDCQWLPRHFAGVDDRGTPLAWDSGCTSFSNEPGDAPIPWAHARLASEFTPE